MAMKATLVSVDEYLHSSYEPDCDYVDGELVERNVGERDHSEVQGAILVHYHNRRREWAVYPYVGQRVKISATRYRVPDVCLMAGRPTEQIFTSPPLAIFEVLSPEDRKSRTKSRIDDYLSIGVRHIWVIHPKTRQVEAHTPQGIRVIEDGVMRTANPDTELPLFEIFEEIEA